MDDVNESMPYECGDDTANEYYLRVTVVRVVVIVIILVRTINTKILTNPVWCNIPTGMKTLIGLLLDNKDPETISHLQDY